MQTLTALEKWSFAIGNMPFSVKDAAFVNFVVFYYTQVQGLSGTMAGLAMFIALSWDAVSDPVVGSWSDRLRSRWGRRHPLLVAGGIPTALLFLALFNPPEGVGSTGMFLWMLGVSMLLRTFLTIYFIPYTAMGAELSTDYDERTILTKARVSMGWLAGMLLPAIAFAVIFQADGDVDGRLLAENYQSYGILSALVAGFAAMFCVWGTRTVISRLPQTDPEAASFSWKQPLIDLKMAFSNRNFRLQMGAALAFGMAAGVYTTMALYLGTYFWEFSTAQLAGLVIPTALATVVAFALLGRIGRRYEKPQILAVSCLILLLNGAWLIGARLTGLLPDNGHPIIYPLQWLSTAIGVFAIVSLQVLGASLMADTLDEQELATGQRQEGVFFAAGAFIGKATTGLGALLAGVVIDLAGIKPGSAPGSVPSGVLNAMGGFTTLLICALAFVAYLFYQKVRMSREQHLQVQQQLVQRAVVSG